MSADELAVLLPERNKREALRIVETIQEQLTRLLASRSDAQGRVSVLTSVAENPLDGGTAEELLRVASARVSERMSGARRICTWSPTTRRICGSTMIWCRWSADRSRAIRCGSSRTA